MTPLMYRVLTERLRLKSVAIALLCVLDPTSLFAQQPSVTYVELAGICGGNVPCFSSIQDAVDAAGDGTTIKVAQGIYHENIFFDHTTYDTSLKFRLEGGWNSDFSTREADPALTIIDGDTDGDGIGDGDVMWLEAAFRGVFLKINIERFTIQNGNSGIFGRAHSTGSIDLSLTENIFRNNKFNGFGGGISIFSEDPLSIAETTLINNLIHDNEAHHGGGVVGFSTFGSATVINIVNNTIANNSANIGGGVGVLIHDVADPNSVPASVEIIIKNTIFWNNSATTNGDDIGIRNFDGTAVVDASFSNIGEVFNDPAFPGNYNDLGNNINLDPLFLDPNGGDFRLGTGSPAIDAGTADGAPNIDFEGHARPQGAGDDMGADEYTPLTVLTAKAGDVWNIGTQQTITWLPGNGKVQIQISRNGGRWKDLGNSTVNDGSRDWKVTKPATDQARFRVCKTGNKLKCGPSGPEFTIQ